MNESLSINKNIKFGSRNLPQCSTYWGCLLHGESIPLPPWPNATHVHSGRQHPSGISRVYGFMICLEYSS